METQTSQESQVQENCIKKFAQAVEIEYLRQSSTPTPPKWNQMQKLISQLKTLQNITIKGKIQQKIFIGCLVEYVELVMCFLSSFDDMEYRKQRHYAKNCLSFIPNIIRETEFKNLFVEEATLKVLDLFMYGNFNLVSKNSLLTMFNEIAGQSKKQIRIQTANNIEYYKYKLLDCLSTLGDYVIQSDVMETLFRIFGNQIRNCENISYELLPGSEELGRALVTEISVPEFDADVRKWLNRFNENSSFIFSIACRKVMYGNYVCLPPKDLDTMWVDFNLKEHMMSFYCEGTDPDMWNRIIIIAKDVKKTEVKRPLGTNESTIFIQMSKSCISERSESQDYLDSQEKNLKLIISNEEKDRINKLITHVLPQVFGDTFSHASDKIATNPRQVYKPLAIKVSKKKSSASDVSSITSASKSKIDSAASTVKVPSLELKGRLSGNAESEKASRSKLEKVSATTISGGKPAHNIDYSFGSLTDFTKFSRRSDGTSDRVSIITSNQSDVFPSSKPASPERSEDSEICRKMDVKVQDNMITSSHENEEENANYKIEILSGRCSGRSVDYQAIVNETFGFQASEVFSSSPLKISKHKPQDIISDQFLSASLLSDEVEKQNHDKENMFVKTKISVLKIHEETAVDKKQEYEAKEDPKENDDDSKLKISTIKSQEEILDDEFETAVENLDNAYLQLEERLKEEHNKIVKHKEKTPTPCVNDNGNSKEVLNIKAVENIATGKMLRSRTRAEVQKNKVDSVELKTVNENLQLVSENPSELTRNKINDKELYFANGKQASSEDNIETVGQTFRHQTRAKNLKKCEKGQNIKVDAVKLKQSNKQKSLATPMHKDKTEPASESDKQVSSEVNIGTIGMTSRCQTRAKHLEKCEKEQRMVDAAELKKINVQVVSKKSLALPMDKDNKEFPLEIVEQVSSEVNIETVGQTIRPRTRANPNECEKAQIIKVDAVQDLHIVPENPLELSTNERSDKQASLLGNDKNLPIENETDVTNIESLKENIGETFIDESHNDKQSTGSVEAVEECNSEEIFSLPLQQQQKEDQNTEQFTDISLAVNVGISDHQLSEDVLQIQREINKQNGNNENVEGEHVLIEDSNKLKKSNAIPDLIGDDIIDLTNDEVTEGTLVTNDKLTKNIKSVEWLNYKKQNMFNTPDLIEILDKDNMQMEKSRKVIENTQNNKIVEEELSQHTLTNEEVLKKKKKRTLIKTGHKRFNLDDLDEYRTVDDSNKNKSDYESCSVVNYVSCSVDVIKNSENHQKKNNLEKHLNKKNTVDLENQEQMNLDNTVEAKGFADKQSEEAKSKLTKTDNKNMIEISSLATGMEHEINEENLEYIAVAGEVEQSGKEKPLDLNQLRSTSSEDLRHPTSTDIETRQDENSSSLSDLAPEMNRENVDFIEAFNEIQKSEKLKPNVIQTMSSPTEKQEVGQIDDNEPRRTAAEAKSEYDNKKNEEEEEVNDLSGFILKKTAKRLFGTQEATSSDENYRQKNEVDEKRIVKSSIPIKKVKKRRAKKQTRKGKAKVSSESQQDNVTQENSNKTSHEMEKCGEKKEAKLPSNKYLDDRKYNGQENDTLAKKDRAIIIHSQEDNIGYRDNEDALVISEDIHKLNTNASEQIASSDNTVQQKEMEVVCTESGYSDPGKVASNNDKVESEIDQLKNLPLEVDDNSDEKPHFRKITTIAQVHSYEETPINEVRKSIRLSNKKSLSQEFQEVENEIQHSYRENPTELKRIIDYDDIQEASPKRRRSSERIRHKSPDYFDHLVPQESQLNEHILNKSKMNTSAANRSRKLFVPGNFTYLDEMPPLIEQKTPPDLDRTPIPMEKGSKLPKPKKNSLNKQTEKPKPADKPKPAPKPRAKTVKSPKEQKPQTKKRTTRGKKKDFSLSTTHFLSLDELFNKACKDLGNNTFGFDHDNSRYGCNSTLPRPVDIAVRSAPQYSSSDDSPAQLKSVLNKKKISPELPKTIATSKTPPTSDFSWPDLEMETVNDRNQQNKINILQDVVIKPKRRSGVLEKQNLKKSRLDTAEVEENIPLPTLQDDDLVNEADTETKTEERTNKDAAEPKGELFLKEMVSLLKFVLKLIERRNDPNSLQKLKSLTETIGNHIN